MKRRKNFNFTQSLFLNNTDSYIRFQIETKKMTVLEKMDNQMRWIDLK